MTRGRWIWDRELMRLVSAEEFHAIEAQRRAQARSALPSPQVMGDTDEYQCPLSFGEVDAEGRPAPVMVTSRSQRRERMKRFGVEEVAPSDKRRFARDQRGGAARKPV